MTMKSTRRASRQAKEVIQDLSKVPSENPNPVLRIARDGTLLYINEAGLSLLPQWHLEVGHASPPVLREAVLQSMDSGSAQEFDLEHGERVYSFFVAPIVAARYANLYARDITDRKRAEDALKESEAKYRMLVEQARDAIFVADQGGKILFANEQACLMLGFTRAELTQLDPTDTYLAEEHAAGAERFAKMRRGELLKYERSMVRKDGTVLSVEIVAGMLPNGSIQGIARDITERRRAEERMQAFSQEIIATRENERKRVSSVLHHDVGSLAVGVSAHLCAIEQDLRSGKPGEALKWTKRTRRLFDESVARLKDVAVQLRPPELDLLGLRAALRQHFSQVTKHGRTRIYFRETLGPRRMPGDTATTLFRIAQEALTNAITHGDAQRVDVFLSASKKAVMLTVRDNGRGFSSSEQKGQATSRMGLRVMKEMAASSGGAFTIDSRPGRGVTVRVSLPLTTPALGRGDVTVREETVARAMTTRSAGRDSRPQKGSGA